MGVGQPELVCAPGTLKQINLVAAQTKAKLCDMAPVCTAKAPHPPGEGGHVQTAHQAWDWRGSVPSLAWCCLAMPCPLRSSHTCAHGGSSLMYAHGD